MEYRETIESIGRVIEFVGVATIVAGMLLGTVSFCLQWKKIGSILVSYRNYRQNIGRSLLLGLEFLVAGDIIRSIAVPPSLTSVVVLAIIVLIRSFLAIELEMEIEGRWPWQKRSAS
jgi:uncharacterized membrane protein